MFRFPICDDRDMIKLSMFTKKNLTTIPDFDPKKGLLLNFFSVV